MYFARTTRNSPDIPAAKAISGRQYRCPVCDKPVFLRSGIYRVPHFAHVSKRANPKCELYHPGSGVIQPMPDHRHGTGRVGDPRAVVAAPYVAIALESRTARIQNAGRRWQFGLVVPKALVGLGQLKIETGFGPLKSLRLSTLMLGEEFVPIKAGSSFGIKWVSDEVDHAYRSAVQQDVDTIVPNDGYIFTGAGKIRTQTSILTWGENYIFIWKSPAHSVPDLVDHYLIADNDGWHAAVVTLPIEQDDAVELWLRNQYGAAISTGVRQWGILYPPPFDRDADGNITVGSLSELLIGFADAGDDGDEDAILVSIEKQKTTIKASATRKRVASIVIPPECDNYPLTFDWGARTLQPILRERRQPTEQAIEFTFRTARGLVKAALHRAAAVDILSEVRAGDAEIVSVHFPQGIAGTLSIREGALVWTEVSRFVGAPNTAGLGDEQIALLTTWLRKRELDVRLSFGGFGEFRANAEYLRATEYTLPRPFRERLEWHLRLTSRGPIRHGLETLSDAAIVKAVSAPNENPAAVARRNVLLNELKIAGLSCER